jgi:hypothetical protein
MATIAMSQTQDVEHEMLEQVENELKSATRL